MPAGLTGLEPGGGLLMLFRLLFNIANFLRELLEGVFVILILGLQLCECCSGC